ncbi:hypothetical protein C8J56DRAFT_852097 [Mycena floridula]|nr:hypothetical protein C8J56DRAFT_852097 [Mycena floridula]
MDAPIVFYDIPSKVPGSAWSLNPWKTRLTLNYKGIPYKTVWVEYPNIKELATSLGAQPTDILPNGDPLYTIPMIHDPSTGAVVSDSAKIAKYLDEQYPDTPKVFAPGTHGLYEAFQDAIMWSAVTPILQFAIPIAPDILRSPSLEYFRATREAMFGMTFEEMKPKEEKRVEEWKKVEAGFRKMLKWFPKDSVFIMGGDKPTFPDFALAAILHSFKLIFGEESKEWKSIETFDEGRWARTLKAWDKYIEVK